MRYPNKPFSITAKESSKRLKFIIQKNAVEVVGKTFGASQPTADFTGYQRGAIPAPHFTIDGIFAANN